MSDEAIDTAALFRAHPVLQIGADDLRKTNSELQLCMMVLLIVAAAVIWPRLLTGVLAIAAVGVLALLKWRELGRSKRSFQFMIAQKLEEDRRQHGA